MIMNNLVAAADLLEPGCFATELVDLYIGVTLNVLDEFEMRPYSLSITYLNRVPTKLYLSHENSQHFDFYIPDCFYYLLSTKESGLCDSCIG